MFLFWQEKILLVIGKRSKLTIFCFVLLSTIIDIGVDWCESGWDGSRGRSRQHPILLDLLSQQHRRKHFDLAQFFYMFQYFNHNWKLQHHTNQQFSYSFSSAAVIWSLTQKPKRYSPIYWEWASPDAAECEPETVQKINYSNEKWYKKEPIIPKDGDKEFIGCCTHKIIPPMRLPC